MEWGMRPARPQGSHPPGLEPAIPEPQIRQQPWLGAVPRADDGISGPRGCCAARGQDRPHEQIILSPPSAEPRGVNGNAPPRVNRPQDGVCPETTGIDRIRVQSRARRALVPGARVSPGASVDARTGCFRGPNPVLAATPSISRLNKAGPRAGPEIAAVRTGTDN